MFHYVLYLILEQIIQRKYKYEMSFVHHLIFLLYIEQSWPIKLVRVCHFFRILKLAVGEQLQHKQNWICTERFTRYVNFKCHRHDTQHQYWLRLAISVVSIWNDIHLQNRQQYDWLFLPFTFNKLQHSINIFQM